MAAPEHTLRELVALSLTGGLLDTYPTLKVYLGSPVQSIAEPYVVIRNLDISRTKVRRKRYRWLHQLEIRVHLESSDLPDETQNTDALQLMLGNALGSIQVPSLDEDDEPIPVRALNGVTFREVEGVMTILVDYALEYGEVPLVAPDTLDEAEVEMLVKEG